MMNDPVAIRGSTDQPLFRLVDVRGTIGTGAIRLRLELATQTLNLILQIIVKAKIGGSLLAFPRMGGC